MCVHNSILNFVILFPFFFSLSLSLHSFFSTHFQFFYVLNVFFFQIQIVLFHFIPHIIVLFMMLFFFTFMRQIRKKIPILIWKVHLFFACLVSLFFLVKKNKVGEAKWKLIKFNFNGQSTNIVPRIIYCKIHFSIKYFVHISYYIFFIMKLDFLRKNSVQLDIDYYRTGKNIFYM